MLKSRLLKNIIFSLLGQIIVIVLGFIIPRIMILSYGSDVNGLLNTIGQIFSYVALLEAGITQAARNALMKPLTEKNYKQISYISSIANSYYKRFAMYYGVVVILLAFICPHIIKTNIDYMSVFVVIFLEGVSGVVSFSQTETIICILSADGRSYIYDGINVISRISVYVIKLFLAYYGLNFILIEVFGLFITLIKVCIFRIYIKNYYPWLNYDLDTKKDKLIDRNSYVLNEVAWTIFASTDIVVLSIFVDTKMASVYAVYNLVFSNLNTLWNALYSSVNYLLGQTYHKNFKQYAKLHDIFSSVFLGGMTWLMCTTYVLILPFVQIYTRGITDVNYIYERVPLLFGAIYILSWSRYVTGNLTGLAGYAKITSMVSVLEAFLNVLLSILLVKPFGMFGVLFASVVSLPIKVIFVTFLSETQILRRNPLKYLSIILINYVAFGCTILISNYFKVIVDDYKDFFLKGSVIFLCTGIICCSLNLIVNPDIIHAIGLLRRKLL